MMESTQNRRMNAASEKWNYVEQNGNLYRDLIKVLPLSVTKLILNRII